MKKFPTISIVVPTRNEEKNISTCLDSIFRQSYPEEKLEVIIADDNSSDKTLEIAKQYPVKIIKHNSKDGEVGKLIAFRRSKGEMFIYIDADVHLRGDNWFEKMLYPLIEDSEITASFTREGYSDEHSAPIEKFLNLDPLQRDPVLAFFSANIKDVVAEERHGYTVCVYKKNKIPPAGRCLHRRDKIEPFLKGKRRFHELNLLADLVIAGNTKFAYVPSTGLFHHHARSLRELLKKRRRNVSLNYFQDMDTRTYYWFDLSSVHGVLKLLFWVIWANLLLPEFLRGVYRAFKHKTFAGLYEPIVSFLVTDIMLFSFLTHKRATSLFGSLRV